VGRLWTAGFKDIIAQGCVYRARAVDMRHTVAILHVLLKKQELHVLLKKTRIACFLLVADDARTTEKKGACGSQKERGAPAGFCLPDLRIR
jgi:hypothetical protein